MEFNEIRNLKSHGNFYACHFFQLPCEKSSMFCMLGSACYTSSVLLVHQLDQHHTSSNRHKPAWTNMKFMMLYAGFFFQLGRLCCKIFHQLEITLWECNLYQNGQEVRDSRCSFTVGCCLYVVSLPFFTVPHRMENSLRTLTVGSRVPCVSPRQSLASPSLRSTCSSRTAS